MIQHLQFRGGGQQRAVSMRRFFAQRTQRLQNRPRHRGAIRCTEAEAAVRCRAALDEGVEAVFEGVAPGYRLEKTAQADTSKTTGAGGGEAAEKAAAGAAGGVKRRGAAVRGVGGGGVERLLEEVRREFSGLPVYVGVEEGYVKRTAPMDQRQFKST